LTSSASCRKGAFAAEKAVASHQQISLSSGLEFRYGKDTGRDAQFRTNFLAWRTSLALPITSRNGVTVSFSTALDGEENTTSTFSIGADWGLLFPGLGGR
jgi:hypothetical protein